MRPGAPLVAALALALASTVAFADRASERFIARQIHDSFPTGLSLVELDGKAWLATISWDGWLKLWDADDGSPGMKVRLSDRRLHRLFVTREGVAVVGGDDGLFVYDLTTRREYAHLSPGVAFRHLAVHPSLPVAYATDVAGHVYHFDLATRQVGSWPALERSPTFFTITPDGETLIATDSETVRLLSSETGALIKTYSPLEPNEPVQTVAFHPAGDVLYVGSGKRVTAVNVLSGERQGSLTVSDTLMVGIHSGATPGELLVTSRGGEIKLWDFDLGTVSVELASAGDEGYSHWAFSADRRRAFALLPIFNWLQAWNL